MSELESIARRVRANIVRMIGMAGSGHPGGSLSAADMLVCLYFRHMRIDPARPRWPGRDRFVLSKGHCAPALYAVLAARGFFPEETLWTLRDLGSILQGHPDMNKTPGVDMTSGSLGQGLSCAVGIALGGRLAGSDFRTYCMISDGEMQSGITWEAAEAAAHYQLERLTVLVDYNKLQVDGETNRVMNIEPVEDKWRAFGWEVARINGHNFDQICEALGAADRNAGRPHVIIADTIKGKGLRAMENNLAWHAKPPSATQVEEFVQEILA